MDTETLKLLLDNLCAEEDDPESLLNRIKPKRLVCDFIAKSHNLAQKKQLDEEITNFYKLTKEQVEERRKQLTKSKKQKYENCERECTERVTRKGSKIPICSNSGHSFDSYCHMNCDKKFVTSRMEIEFVGECGDPKKYPYPFKP